MFIFKSNGKDDGISYDEEHFASVDECIFNSSKSLTIYKDDTYGKRNKIR